MACSFPGRNVQAVTACRARARPDVSGNGPRTVAVTPQSGTGPFDRS